MKRRDDERTVHAETAKLIGENIRAARAARGWSAAELARRARLAQPTVTSYELGLRLAPVYRVVAFAGLLEVSVLYLLGAQQEASKANEYEAGFLDGWNAHERRIEAFNISTYGNPATSLRAARQAADELVAEFEAGHGPIPPEALAEADAALDLVKTDATGHEPGRMRGNAA